MGGTGVARTRGLGRVQRTRRDLTRADLTEFHGGLYDASDRWSKTDFQPLANVVTQVASWVEAPPKGPPGRVAIATGEIATTLLGDNDYVADVLDPLLDGLPWSGRANHLRSADALLWDWGTGPMPMHPPAAAGALPDTLTYDELRQVLSAPPQLPCFKRKKRDAAPQRLQVTLALAPSGRPVKVTAVVHPQFGDLAHPPPSAVLRCVERELMKRTWPPFAAPVEPFQADLFY